MSKNKKGFNRIGTFLVITTCVTMLFSSCVSQRNVEYLRDTSEQQGDIKTFYDAKVPDYKLKPKDELFIQIKSLDDPSTNVFQQLGIQESGSMSYIQPYGASLMSYTVDKAGLYTTSGSWKYSGGKQISS